MELSRTINSDKRYYLDENTIENAASFLQTMRVFNDAKIDLYNALYDQKYLASGPLIDHAYPVFLKEKYKTNDYYNAAIYLAASGSISSQKELKKYYITTITADLKTRDEKIQTIQEALDKKNEQAGVNFTLIHKPGEFDIDNYCSRDEIFEALKQI